MAQAFDRRNLLKAGLGLAGGMMAANATTPVARAIEPIERNKTPKFKFSLAAYSYRELLAGKKASLTLDDFVKDCAAFGLEGTELTSYYFPKPVTTEYLRKLKGLCFRYGLDISGTAIGNDFCHPAGPVRDKQIADAKAWIDHADALDAPVIRIFSGNTKPGQTPEEAHRLAVQAIEECCDYAGSKGIYLALENHGGLTETADGLLKLVNDVKSPWFGVNFDSGNFHSADVYAELEKIAPYAINAQIKVVVSPSKKGKEPSDFKRLAKMLRDAGYRGYIVLEYEEPGDPRKECPKFLDQLREAFA